MRTATAIASDARESSRTPLLSTSSAKKMPPSRATISARSSRTPTASSRSRSRSCVMGRGVGSPACAMAIALASRGPMTIGTTSSDASSSSSTTISWSRCC
ncbi:Uncharacterised protein [Mycobacteroides abscessus]|nr:Uncharacterised protein [Mycobacteroides abscessus]